MRPRRASRASLGRGDEEEELEQLEEEEAPRRRGRRAGKAPIDEDEDYQPADEQEEEGGSGRAARGRLAGSRRSLGGGDDEAGPSQKRGRRGGAAAGVKPEPAGDLAGPSQRAQAGAAGAAAAAAAAAGGGGIGAEHVTAAQLRAVDETIAQYRRMKDHAFEKAHGKAPAMAMEAAARAVVRHMLFSHSEKPGVPVKRTELVTVVTSRFPNLKNKGPVTSYVIAHAQLYLAESMGLEMRPVARRSAAAAGREATQGSEEGTQQYALRSIVPPPLRAAFVLDDQDSERGLLMVVLALVHLAGGKLDEEELFTQLAELGVSKEQPHPVLGQPAVLLKSFCTRRYIQQDKQQGPDGEVILYRFAEQAVGPDAEVGEAAIRRFIEAQFAEVA
ncbi:hypothetical protein ABPG75_011091 [Micractinium tetrahymenae]